MSKPRLTPETVSADDLGGLALLAQLHKQSFSVLDERNWSIATFQNLLQSAGMEALLYKDDQIPIGFAVVRRVVDEAELITFAVDPAWQGRGCGRIILRDVFSRLKDKGVTSFFLEVRKDNAPAIGLYESLGFQQISERKDYYQTLGGKRVDAFTFSICIE